MAFNCEAPEVLARLIRRDGLQVAKNLTLKLENAVMEFHELQQIVESNARAIQALADRISELTDIQSVKQIEISIFNS